MKCLNLADGQKFRISDLSYFYLNRLGILLIDDEKYQIIVQAKPRRDYNTKKIIEDRGFFNEVPGSVQEEKLKLLAIRQKLQRMAWEEVTGETTTREVLDMMRSIIEKIPDTNANVEDIIGLCRDQFNITTQFAGQTQSRAQLQPVLVVGYLLGILKDYLESFEGRESFKIELTPVKTE